MVRRSVSIALVLGLCTVFTASSEVHGLSFGLRFTPEAVFPLGQSTEYYGIGPGGNISLLANLSSLPWLSPALDLGYGFAPIDAAEATASLSFARAGLGVVAALPLGQRFCAQALAAGGYLAALLHGGSGSAASSFYLRGGVGMSFFLSSRLSVDLLGAYGYSHGLFQGASAGLGATVRLRGAGGGPIPLHSVPLLQRPQKLQASSYLRVSGATLDTVFPVLFKYYDTHPLGTLTIENISKRLVEGIEVRLDMEKYIDNPKLSARLERLGPGEKATVELFALFNEQVLTITEGTKVAAQLRLDYQANSKPVRTETTLTVEMYDRNALRWDDDAKIAAFVTAKDDEILRFARNSAAVLRDNKLPGWSENLQVAVVMLAALKLHGLTYTVDPSSSFRELSENPLGVDYVQFPRQTLQFKAGDCDDLSATMCALLEGVGVPSAFITVPGHIFTALRLDIEASELPKAFSRPEDVIVRDDGTVWLPVETTLLKEGFLRAWVEGARQWREYSKGAQADFLSVAEAWATYQPVAFAVTSFAADPPAPSELAEAFRTEIDRLVTREIAEPEKGFLAELRQKPQDPGLHNRLGVLYARYGLAAKAEIHFRAAVERKGYAPALVNLGNLRFRTSDPREALGFYEQALKADPRSTGALLGLARVHHHLENYGEVKRRYEQLAALDGQLAQRFSYLQMKGEEASRAADASFSARAMVWEE